MVNKTGDVELKFFLERYILGRDNVVATVKSVDGASVNIDGPLELKTFLFDRAPADEVIQPKGSVAKVTLGTGTKYITR